MNDVVSALREMESRVEEGLLADPHTLRHELAPRMARRRRARTASLAVAVAGAAAVAAVVVGSGIAPRGDRSAPPVGPVIPSLTASPQVSPAPRGAHSPEDGWQRVDHGFGTTVGFRAVAYRDGRYVAVGDTSRGDARVPVWWSDDGLRWHRSGPADGPATANVWDVVAVDGGFAAVGVEPGRTWTAWFSADGEVWRRSETIPGTFRPFGLTATRVGLVAWGNQRVWISSDRARSWTEPAGGPVFERVRGEGNPCWVEETRTGLVALALGEPVGGGDPVAVRWASSDGRHWEQAESRTGSGLRLCVAPEHRHEQVQGAAGSLALEPWGEDDGVLFFRPAAAAGP